MSIKLKQKLLYLRPPNGVNEKLCSTFLCANTPAILWTIFAWIHKIRTNSLYFLFIMAFESMCSEMMSSFDWVSIRKYICLPTWLKKYWNWIKNNISSRPEQLLKFYWPVHIFFLIRWLANVRNKFNGPRENKRMKWNENIAKSFIKLIQFNRPG